MALFKNIAETIVNMAQESQRESPVLVGDPILTALLSGEKITRSMAMGIPKVSSSVRKICDTVSMVSFKLYRREISSTGRHKIVEIYDDDRLKVVNSDTGDTLTAGEFKKALVKDYLLGRGGYAFVNRSGNDVISLNYIPEYKLNFYANANPIFKSYSVDLEGRRYFEDSFFRILRNTTDGFKGAGVLAEINKALEAAYSSLLYTLRLTKTGGIKKGYLTYDGPSKLEGTALDELRSAWQRMYSQGTENIIVLNKGLKFEEASQSALDMELTQIRTTLNSDISEAFGIEKDDEIFLKYTIAPILMSIEAALDRYLLLEREKDIMFWKADTRELDKLDPVKRYTALKTATTGGLMSINEARYKENMPEIDGLDKIPMSLGTSFFDIPSGEFYTPNTGQISSGTSSGEGGEN